MSRRHLLRVLPLAGLLLACSALSWQSGPGRSHAEAGGPGMAIAIEGGGAVCDTTPYPTTCNLGLDTAFTVAVDAAAPPEAGYAGFQTALYYAGFSYLVRPVQDEIAWPESALPARFPASPTGAEGTVDHGDLSANSPPFPVSHHAGRLVAIHAACPLESSTLTLALIPYSPAYLLGAAYKDAAGLTVPAKTTGQASLDITGDGTPELTDVADAVQINCGLGGPTATPPAPATPTLTPTGTRTRTRTPTQTPTPLLGDANCDGAVNSIDAALTLQLVARLLEAFNCPADVDVNGDGRVDAVDAALILQFDAGFLHSLPP